MAKIKDAIKEEVVDKYKWHKFHDSYHSDCSSCFTENLVLKRRREELGTPINQGRFEDACRSWNDNPLG